MQQSKTKFSVEFMSFQPVPSHFYMCSRTLEFESFTCVLHAQGQLIFWSMCIWDYLFKKLREKYLACPCSDFLYDSWKYIKKQNNLKKYLFQNLARQNSRHHDMQATGSSSTINKPAIRKQVDDSAVVCLARYEIYTSTCTVIGMFHNNLRNYQFS